MQKKQDKDHIKIFFKKKKKKSSFKAKTFYALIKPLRGCGVCKLFYSAIMGYKRLQTGEYLH